MAPLNKIECIPFRANVHQGILKPIKTNLTFVTESERSKGIWYFAYGANMSPNILAERGVQPIFATRAKLNGFKFSYNAPGNPFSEDEVYANVIRSTKDQFVFGVLYLLTADDIEKLDDHEIIYRRVTMPVEMFDGSTVESEVYTAFFTLDDLTPSCRYYDELILGAYWACLPDEHLHFLGDSRCKTK